jgi:hypothetical protein
MDSSACYCRENGNDLPVVDGSVDTVEEPDVVLGDEDIDEAPGLAVLEETGTEVGITQGEIVEKLGEPPGLDFDRRRAVGECA